MGMGVGGVEAFCSRPSVWRPMKSGPSVLCCRGLRGYNFLVRMEVLSQGGGNHFGALVGRLVNWPVLTLWVKKQTYLSAVSHNSTQKECIHGCDKMRSPSK